MNYKIMENSFIKSLWSDEYKYWFDKKEGKFARWGEKFENDPKYSSFGPEIVDMEISSICTGINNIPCSHCYKSNISIGNNMSFETFKKIFHKLPRTVTQIAFGIGSLNTNPDLWDIMIYCRSNEYNYVIPNITINGWNLTNEESDKLADVCGSVAVSYYGNECCFDAVKMLTDRGMSQINIHGMLCEETYDSCFELLNKAKTDNRLKGLNAIVFLMLKEKGTRNKYHTLKDRNKYKKLIDYAFERNIKIGFDSCSCSSFLNAIKDRTNYKNLEMASEPCESTLFSIYINVDGRVFPCSFCEGEKDWKDGIYLLEYDDFMGVWYYTKLVNWRNKLLENKRNCFTFDL